MQTINFAWCSLTTNRMKFPFDPTQHSGVCWVLEKTLLPPKVFVNLLSDPVGDRSSEAVIRKSVEDKLSCQRIILPMKHLQSSFLVVFFFFIYISNLKSSHLWQRAAFNLQRSGVPRSAAFRG